MSEITFWHNIQQRGTRGNGSNRKEWVWVNQWAPFMGTDRSNGKERVVTELISY